jgi:hypothetical protein
MGFFSDMPFLGSYTKYLKHIFGLSGINLEITLELDFLHIDISSELQYISINIGFFHHTQIFRILVCQCNQYVPYPVCFA